MDYHKKLKNIYLYIMSCFQYIHKQFRDLMLPCLTYDGNWVGAPARPGDRWRYSVFSLLVLQFVRIRYSQTTPGQKKQVQMELQQILACRELVDQIRMLILSGMHLIMNLLQIKRITILIETFTMSYAYQIMNQR